MTPNGKILLGGLATCVVAWFLHGPMGFGARCQAEAGLLAGQAQAEAPASAQQVAACQAGVDKAISGKTVQFDSGGAAIAVDSQALVAAIGAAARDCVGTRLDISGHTDRTGSDATNLALSQARADAVKAALIKAGVPGARMAAKGYGESQPTNPKWAERNPADRRITFKVSTTTATAGPQEGK